MPVAHALTHAHALLSRFRRRPVLHVTTQVRSSAFPPSSVSADADSGGASQRPPIRTSTSRTGRRHGLGAPHAEATLAPGAHRDRAAQQEPRAYICGAGCCCGCCLALPLVAPPRPRRVAPDSVRMRCTKPYDRPVESASVRMLAPLSYFLRRSAASRSRSPPVTRLPFLRVSATVSPLLARLSGVL